MKKRQQTRFEQSLTKKKKEEMFAKSTPSTQEVHTGKPLIDCEERKEDFFEAERAKDGQRITCDGAAYLLDGSVVLLDTVHKRCLLYDPSHHNTAEIELSSKPHSVTHMGQRRIAVSLPEENMIQVLEVGSVFRFEQNVYTDWPCYALASAGDDKIVVCYRVKHYPEVVMINLDGDKKCTLYTRSHGLTDVGRISIAYDKLRKRTCVAETNPDAMHVMLKDGSERFTYPDEFTSIKFLGSGVDYDQQGNLYFISEHNGINQVSVNGALLHKWAFKCESPTAFCFDPNGMDFIVATMSGEVHFSNCSRYLT